MPKTNRALPINVDPTSLGNTEASRFLIDLLDVPNNRRDWGKCERRYSSFCFHMKAIDDFEFDQWNYFAQLTLKDCVEKINSLVFINPRSAGLLRNVCFAKFRQIYGEKHK